MAGCSNSRKTSCGIQYTFFCVVMLLDKLSFYRHISIISNLQGVIEYSFSLFFTKLINYTFLYWLPTYLKNSSRVYNCICFLLSYIIHRIRDWSFFFQTSFGLQVVRWAVKKQPNCQLFLTLVVFSVVYWLVF